MEHHLMYSVSLALHECSTELNNAFLRPSGVCILAIPPPPGGGGQFLSKLKNREEFAGGLHEKRKEKGGKEE